VQFSVSAGLRVGGDERGSNTDWLSCLYWDLSVRRRRHRPGRSAGLIRSLTAQFTLSVSHHSPAVAQVPEPDQESVKQVPEPRCQA
jgi:hypothetical protein